MDTDDRSLVGVAVAACVACCAAPVAAVLLGVGVAGLLSTVLIGMAGAVIAGAAAVGLVLVRRRRRACDTPPTDQIPVSGPTSRSPHRPRIPLHDETAPIACTISEHEIPDRVALLERLRSHVTHIEASEHGLVLHFAARSDVEADVRRFARDEKRCCGFWGFGVTEEADEVTLQWDAPPGARNILDGIEAYLRGDEPLSSLSGLL